MRFRTGVVAGLALIATAGLAVPSQAPVLGTPTPLAVPNGEHPIGIAIADVTGDGKADAVMAANDFARVLVYGGDGAGGFGSPVSVATSAGNCTRLRAARLNADAVSDLVADHVNTTTVDVLLADGTGGFSLKTYAAPDGAGGESEYVCLADWDGDGDTDIVTSSSTGKVRVRLNDGAGAFAAAQTIAYAAGTTAPSSSFDVVAADLDGDGDVDVALRETTSTGVYWRQSDGTLAAGPRLSPPQSSGFSNHGIVAADFDGDGWNDVAEMRTVSLGGPPPRGAVNVFRHTAAATFAAAEPYAITTGQWDLATADLNGDLFPEIVTPTDLLTNLGDGKFAAATALPAPGWGVATGGFDGDPRPDIVVADVFNGGNAIAVRGAASDPFVASIAPATVHVGATRTVTLGGSGFASGATVDFGPGVTVQSTDVPQATTLLAQVTVSATATPGGAVAKVTNPAGGSASVRYTIAAGGSAEVLSMTPDHANAGDAATVTVKGSGFEGPATASLGAAVVVNTVEVVDGETLRIVVAVPLDAAAGDRSLTIVNGTGVRTVVPDAFTVVRAPSIDVAATKGVLHGSPKRHRGSVDVRGTFQFNRYSLDHLFDGKTEAAVIAVGDPLAPATISVPPGKGWKVRRGRAVWRSAGRSLPKVTLTLDVAKGTFRLVATRMDLAAPAASDVRFDLTLGDDRGASVATWTVPKRGGGLRLP